MLIGSPKEKRKILLDFTIFFILIPLLIVILFLFPDALKNSLILHPENPTILSIFFSNYIHKSLTHFSNNMLSYLVIIVPIFIFNLLINRGRFYKAMLLIFILLPIISSVLIIILFFILYGFKGDFFGFSAVVASLFGFLPYSLLSFLRDFYKIKFDRFWILLVSIFLVNASIISTIYGGYILLLIIIPWIIVFLYLSLGDIKNMAEFMGELLRKKKFAKCMFLMCCILFCFFSIISFFPQRLITNNILVNIFSHYVGYAFGFFIPAILLKD